METWFHRKNKTTVALSTFKAEYMALTETTQEAIFLRQILSNHMDDHGNFVTIYRVWWVNCRLNYAKMTSHFIRYIYQITRKSLDILYSKKSPLAEATATSESPASLSKGLLVKIDKCCCYTCFNLGIKARCFRWCGRRNLLTAKTG